MGMIDTEKIRNAAGVLDTLTSKLDHNHRLRVEAEHIAKSSVSFLYEIADTIDDQATEIARLREAQAWQPIETAPKDGTEILMWRDDCGAFIASFTSVSEFPLSQREIDALDEETLFAKDWFTQWPQALRMEGSERPTHWMPVPIGPITLSGESHD